MGMARVVKAVACAMALFALAVTSGCGDAAASGGPEPPRGSGAAGVPDGGAGGGGGQSGGRSDGDRPDAGPAGPANKVVFVIAMENAREGLLESSADFPYLTGLLPQAARASAFMDLLPDMPSEPHYLLMEAGTNVFPDHTFSDDDSPSAKNSTASSEHLVTQLGAAGISWTSYQEGMGAETGSCPISGAGHYRPRHNPFIFFQDVAGMPPSKTAPMCVAHHEPVSSLASDLTAGKVAAYNFITPDLCHDAHGHDDCAPSDTSDKWLQATMPAILTYATDHDGVVFVIWDEAHSGAVLPFLALGPHVKPGYVSMTPYDHRSFLKTVQEILGVPPLPASASATDLSDLFVPGQFP
jgi:hypothetical protein